MFGLELVYDNGFVLLGRKPFETGNFVSPREIGGIRIKKGRWSLIYV